MASLLGAALRVHGGMDRWQQVSLIRARILAWRATPAGEQWSLFELQASTRLPVVCIEHQAPGGLISSYRNGLLAVHQPDGQHLALEGDGNGGITDDAWSVFRLSGFLWLVMNAPFVLATPGFASEPVIRPPKRARLHIEPPVPFGGRTRPITATLTDDGVLCALHQRMDGGVNATASVARSAHGLDRGLLVARRQRVRMRAPDRHGPLLCLTIELLGLA